MGTKRLHDFVKVESTEDVLREVKTILQRIAPIDDRRIVAAYDAIVGLYRGDFPGYQACNTYYHDLRHTVDTFLTLSRLIHGATRHNETFSDRQITLGLIAALFHDAGYIQEDDDKVGTGAKHTAVHVRRSMDFLSRYGAEFGLTADEIADGRMMILCTDLSVDLSAVTHPERRIELLGKMLGAGDILAQMADPLYLEKLLFLYHEFKEGMIGDYEGEVDLLRKTIGFYDIITRRLAGFAKAVDGYITAHFTERWDVHENLYTVAITNHKNYLLKILDQKDTDPREFLRRSGIVDKVREKYGAE